MKKIICLFLALFFAIALHSADIGNLWCIGDSWTDCYNNRTWRRQVSQDLTSLGWGVDFVGTRTDSATCEAGKGAFDKQHNGLAGATSDNVTNNISNWLTTITPDVAFVLIGGNDILNGRSIAAIQGDIELIVDIIKDDNPNVIIFLGCYGYINAISDSTMNSFATMLQSVATQKGLVFVDHRIGWNKNLYLINDGIHPNDAGVSVIANNWLNAVKNYFGSTINKPTNLNGQLK